MTPVSEMLLILSTLTAIVSLGCSVYIWKYFKRIKKSQ